jgi:probable phosphoglycerate mutase
MASSGSLENSGTTRFRYGTICPATAVSGSEKMTTFYIIRHGETDWNLSGRWQGHTDVPLNALGRAQARRLAERLRAEHLRFDAIYSSDLLRAWETAQALATALGSVPRPLVELREIDVGAWSGLTRAEVLARDPDLIARLESGEDAPRGGSGERFADLYQRVVGAVERLAAAEPGGRLALVTHGGTIRALLLHAARDKTNALPRRLHIGNTSISVLICDRSGWSFGAINDMSHLEDDAQAPDMMSAPPDDAERPL